MFIYQIVYNLFSISYVKNDKRENKFLYLIDINSVFNSPKPLRRDRRLGLNFFKRFPEGV